MVALFLSAGFLLIVAAVLGKLSGNTTMPQFITVSIVGVLIAAVSLFFTHTRNRGREAAEGDGRCLLLG